MQVEVKDYLRLVEANRTLAFVDIEGTGLKGDYNSILCVSFKPFDEKPYTLVVDRIGDDRRLVRAVRDEIERFDVICTYYGTGYDLPMIQTRLLNAKQRELKPMHHIDLYFKLKYKLLLARRSQAHLLRFVNTLQQKMDMSPNEWNEVIANPEKGLKRMVERCESDVEGLEALYNKTKHLIRDVKRS